MQETRLWDPDRGMSPWRCASKEQAHDYRYFPEPDLPPVVVDEAWMTRARKALPELPEARYARYTAAGLSAQDAAVLVAERAIGDYFDKAVAAAPGHPRRSPTGSSTKCSAGWRIPRQLTEAAIPIPPAALAELVDLVEKGTLSGKLGKDVFARMWQEKRRAGDIVAAESVGLVSDVSVIEEACKRVVERSPAEVERYPPGRPKVLGFFVGNVMKETGGKADPKIVNEILRKLLG